MPRFVATIAVFGVAAFVSAQAPLAVRYGFEHLDAFYPQKMPHEALKSAVKAVDDKRFDYLLAQIADPEYVDVTVNQYKSLFAKGSDQAKTVLAFDRLVKETAQYYLEDPTLIRELRQFAKDGDWEVNDKQATATLKAIPGRKVFLKKLGERWFLENKQQ